MLLAPGALVGPYELLAAIGAGGTGEVYRAHDPRIGRDIALKILFRRNDDDGAHQQRLREARIPGTLNHPNILSVYDVGRHDGHPFIVTELVAGTTLRAELERSKMALPRMLDIAVQIADGLAAAHQAGLVHRDLKPENIMIATGGRVKIVDFGLATSVTASAESPAAGPTVTVPYGVEGTAPYMSPEQARGTAVDFRSDIFSFGAILYEMATGRRAFQRSSPVETLSAVLRDDPPGYAGVKPVVPAPVQWIIDRCLAKDPARRYAATLDLVQDLRALGDRLPHASSIAVRPAPLRWRLVQWLGAAGALAGALLLGLVAAMFLVPDQPGLSSYRFTPFATEPGYEGYPAWSPDGRRVAYVADVNGTLQVMTRSLDSPTPAQVTHAVADCRNPFWSSDNSTVYYISLMGDREGLWSIGPGSRTPKSVLENVNYAAISPDNGAIVFLREDSAQGGFSLTMWKSSPVGAAPTPFTPGALKGERYTVGFLQFSPDGTRLALWGNVITGGGPADRTEQPEFWVIPFPTGEPRAVLPGLARAPVAQPFSWMRDSRRIVVGTPYLTASEGTHLWIGDTETGALRLVSASPGNEYSPAASPDGARIVFGTESSNYDVVEIPLDRSPVRMRLGSVRQEMDPVWSPSPPGAREFAYVTDRTGQPEIWLKSADGTLDEPKVTARNFPDETFMLTELSFSPDGRSLVYQRRNASGWHLWVSAMAGGPAAQLILKEVVPYQDAPTWSPDGEWIAFVSNIQGHWSLAKVHPGTREAPVPIVQNIIYPSHPKWSPDGRWITCELEDGFNIVSPDGRQRRLLSADTWVAHTWTRDSSAVLAVRQTEDMHLQLISVPLSGGTFIVREDLGPSPPTTSPLKGFSLGPDGKTILTSTVELRGDLMILEGFDSRTGPLSRLWSVLRRHTGAAP